MWLFHLLHCYPPAGNNVCCMDVTQSLDIQTLWNEVSKTVQESVSANSFNTWLSGVYPMRLESEGRVLVLGVPNELTRTWIQKKYQNIISSEVVKINPEVRTVKLTISRRATVKKKVRSAAQEKNVPLELKTFDTDTNLNPDFTFEEFVIAPYNRFAYTAAQVVIEKFGTLYNPFYIYGPTGVGKTHLLQAIGNRIKKINPSLNMYYTTSETFMENYINAIKKDRVKEFRNTYRNYSLFIIDDVHFLEKSDSTIIEIFHLFNALINKNAQIILSSDQPPTQLDKMDARIRTRLNSGVVIDIEQPKEEDMRIVCTEKIQKMGLRMSPDAVDYIVEKVSRNIREVNGALKSIHLHSAGNPEKEVNLEDVKRFVKNYIRPKNTASCDNVIESVCEFYGIQKNVLTTKTRKREIVRARQIIMYIFRENLGLSYSFIGKRFGNRDHTTVMHACEKVHKGLQENSIFQKDYEKLVKHVGF